VARDTRGPDEAADRLPLVRMASLFYGAMLAIALLWALWTGRSLLFASSEAALRGWAPLNDVGAGLLAGAVVVLISREFTRRTRAGDALARAFGEVLGRLSLADCLLLAAWSSVGEEAFFRGALQPLLGWVTASLVFGLVHFVPRREFLPWTGFAVLVGFLLGWLFEATGNLVAPVVAHAVVNALNLRFLALHYAGEAGGR